MKIALICPSNLLFMPYVKNYRIILDENKIKYDVINWDRFQNEPLNTLTYRDHKLGHKRNIFDYYKYGQFIINKIVSNKYDKLIIFGIQIAFVLRSFLKKYKNKYIFDIRDYNRVNRFYNLNKIIHNSAFTVLSSPGFKSWLPESEKYIINHNTNLKEINNVSKNSFVNINKINISYIGTLRDLEININLIKSLKNNYKFNLYYHGDGIINKQIEKYLKDNRINNVIVTGRYQKNEENRLYAESDLINVLIPNTDINSRTLLPNRLYNSVIFGKPLITYNGTYLAQLVTEYRLGLVINSFDNLDKQIEHYLTNLNQDTYMNNRIKYLKKVINENKFFEKQLVNFIKM